MNNFWNNIKEVGKTNPRKFIRSNGITVIIFCASWSRPCRMSMPSIEKLAERYKNVTFLYVDTDDNAKAAVDYQVRSVPTTIFFINSENANKSLINVDEKEIGKVLDMLLNIWNEKKTPNREQELELIIAEATKELEDIRKSVSWEEACEAIYKNIDNKHDKVVVAPVDNTGENYRGFEGIGILYCKHAISKEKTKYRIIYEH